VENPLWYHYDLLSYRNDITTISTVRNGAGDKGPVYLIVEENQLRAHHRAPIPARWAFPRTTAYRSPASVTRSVPRRTCSGTTMKPARELRIRS